MKLSVFYDHILQAAEQTGKPLTELLRNVKNAGIEAVEINMSYLNQMLMERHLSKKARRGSHKNHMKGPRKRTDEDDERFAQSFEKLVLIAMRS